MSIFDQRLDLEDSYSIQKQKSGCGIEMKMSGVRNLWTFVLLDWKWKIDIIENWLKVSVFS